MAPKNTDSPLVPNKPPSERTAEEILATQPVTDETALAAAEALALAEANARTTEESEKPASKFDLTLLDERLTAIESFFTSGNATATDDNLENRFNDAAENFHNRLTVIEANFETLASELADKIGAMIENANETQRRLTVIEQSPKIKADTIVENDFIYHPVTGFREKISDLPTINETLPRVIEGASHTLMRVRPSFLPPVRQ